jgi:signal transduction histidine kinase
MNEYLRKHFGAKLFLSYLAIIGVGLLVLILASQFVLPAAFNSHMGMMLGQGAGMGNGMMGRNRNGTMPQFFLDFRSSFNEALMYAALAAIVVAVLVSLFFSRRVIVPVQAMSSAAQHIAEGHYDERVQVRGEDELAQLAERFNQMAEKLNEVEATRRRLIADVSHELRTPLTAIKGSMEGLMDGVLPATAETYTQIHAEADRLNRLVDDLQELSRIEAQAYQLEIRPVDVSPAIKTVIKRLSPQAESRHTSLDHKIAASLPVVYADEDRLIQVLTNLTGNALQYTPENGKVSIAAEPTNGAVRFSVHDTGVGIPPEHLTHIFDRFYRVDKSRSRGAGGGSGIGLTIARALVEAQGGHIWAESPGEGQGSTFIFTLPVAKKGVTQS